MLMSHSGWAEWRRFSAALLALIGVFSVVEGLVAMHGGGAPAERSGMLFLHPPLWGQASAGMGALLLVLGGWLRMVTVRVRLAVAVPAVMLHGLGQVGVLAAYPIWALLMIGFDVLVIFALTVSPASTARVGASAVSGSRGGYRPRHLWLPAAATVVFFPCVDFAAMDAPTEFASGTEPIPPAPLPVPPSPAPAPSPLPVSARGTAALAPVPARGTAAIASRAAIASPAAIAAPEAITAAPHPAPDSPAEIARGVVRVPHGGVVAGAASAVVVAGATPAVVVAGATPAVVVAGAAPAVVVTGAAPAGAATVPAPPDGPATAPVDYAGTFASTASGPVARPYVNAMTEPWARSMSGSAERSPAGVLNRALPGATAKRPARQDDGSPAILGAISGRHPDAPLQI